MPKFGEFVAMMAALMAMTALSVDIMLPALPNIREDFGLVDPNAQQLVITAYVAGFALGQFFHGPLSDGIGRRAVLLGGLAAYTVASIACFVSGSFELLLLARVVQGLANAAPRIVAVAVVRDLYGGRRMAEVMSFVMMIFIVAPVIAPSIGGAFLLFGTWHLIFVFLALLGAASLAWMALRLPETRPRESREAMSIGWVAGAFGEAIANRQTLGYTLATGIVFGSLMGYINSAQQIYVEIFGLGALFPIVFGACAAALAVASFVNSRLVGRVGMRRVSHAALLGFVGSGVIHAVLAITTGVPLWAFVSLLSISLFGFGLMMPNFNALAMEPMGRIAGTASSFVGAVTTALGAGLGLWIGQAYDGTVVPLTVGFAGLGLGSLLVVLLTERGRLFRVNPPRPR
jgi:DHA1 family bicyclomycin/chloramphenicol resistance-like MFS transporter